LPTGTATSAHEASPAASPPFEAASRARNPDSQSRPLQRPAKAGHSTRASATSAAGASTAAARLSPVSSSPSVASVERSPEAATEMPTPHDSAPGSPEAAAPAPSGVRQAPAGSAPAPSSHHSRRASAECELDHPAGPPLAPSQAAGARCISRTTSCQHKKKREGFHRLSPRFMRSPKTKPFSGPRQAQPRWRSPQK
jgi:hypothetical protein